MNTENRVFNKLAQAEKVELSAQKIELGMLQDLNKRKEKFIQKNKEIAKLIQSVSKLKSQFKSDFKNLSKENSNLSNDYNSLFNKAIDIGAEKLGDDVFRSKNELANSYGKGWDKDILRFLQK